MSLIDMITGALETHMSFIEANYHINDPLLLVERREMMKEGNTGDGIAIDPRIEASPRYQQDLELLGQGLPDAVEAVLSDFIEEGSGVFNTPYTHQLHGLLNFFGVGQDPRDLVVMTGTGSGKTEIFFWSILGHLAEEFSRSGNTEQRGIRTLIMYPMNALVSDQLGRMRNIMGLRSPENSTGGSEILARHFGRTAQFMQYTSRAPYHGGHNDDRNQARLLPLFQEWNDLENAYNADPNSQEGSLYRDLRRKGRIPEKNLQGFLDNDYWTSTDDPELFARHEARDGNPVNTEGGVPDLLVTNYAMLEFMLLRPIEDPFWADTRTWLHQHKDNQLLMVLDEAHLYRGARGAEVAMLLRRFMRRIGVGPANREKIRFILTSASFSDGPAACEFASQLTGKPTEDFVPIEPTWAPDFPDPAGATTNQDIGLLSEVQAVPSITDQTLLDWMEQRGWSSPQPGASIGEHLGASIREDSLCMHAGRYLEGCTNRISTLTDFTDEVFPPDNHRGTTFVQRRSAALNLVNLLSVAQNPAPRKLLSLRLHMMFRSLDKNFVCINSECTNRRVNPGQDPRANDATLGRLGVGLPVDGRCDCGSIMAELVTHRDCGASYLKLFVTHPFRWPPAPPPPRTVVTYNKPQMNLKQLLVLVSPPSNRAGWETIEDDNQARGFLEKTTGILHYTVPGGLDASDFLRVWLPGNQLQAAGATGQGAPVITTSNPRRSTWRHCPHCTQANRGLGNTSYNLHGRIQDLQVKGTAPFSNLLAEVFNRQPAQTGNTNPNQGRKMIAFSDSTNKAGELAIDMQDDTETDRFREILFRFHDRIISPRDENHLGITYPAFLEYLQQHEVAFFDREDRQQIIDTKSLKLVTQPSLDNDPRHHQLLSLDMQAPPSFYGSLLHAFGHRDFSVRALNAGYVTYRQDALEHLDQALENQIPDQENRRTVLAEIVNAAMRRFALCHITTVAGGFAAVTHRHFIPSPRLGQPCRIADPYWRLDELDNFWGAAEDDMRRILGRAHALGVIPNEADIAAIRNVLVEPGLIQQETVNDQVRHLINIEYLSLINAVQHEIWYRCEGCKSVNPHAYNIDGGRACTQCGHTVVNEVRPRDVLGDWEVGDIHLQTRKRHLLRPVLTAITSNEPIRTLRTEEHSAQISGREDENEAYARTELYELLFQEIPVGEDPQPVDILSCTTTMEVGIDIGGITAVALRTIPPRPDNYQQRAGRAGRSNTSLSTIVSYANVRPHDMHYFRNPEEIIGQSPEDPEIYVANQVIAERHCSATLLETYIQHVGPLPIDGELVNTMGSAGQFFGYSNPFHPGWISTDYSTYLQTMNPNPGTLNPSINEILDAMPEQLFVDRDEAEEWIQVQIQDMIEWLGQRVQGGPEELIPEHQEMGFMEYLLQEMKLPKFAFPLKSVNFRAEEYRYQFHNSNIRPAYNPSKDGAVALTMYAPGRLITMDKHRMVSSGLIFPGQRNMIQARARRKLNDIHWNMTQDPSYEYGPANWPEPTVEYLNFCPHCRTVHSDRSEDLSGEQCTACTQSVLLNLRYIEPEAYAPEHKGKSRHASVRNHPLNKANDGTGFSSVAKGYTPRFTIAESRYPLEDDLTGIAPNSILPEHSMRYSRESQSILIVNDNNGEGYEICLDCGAIDPTAQGQGHWRPYARRKQDEAAYPFQRATCISNDRARYVLAHSIDSSVVVIHTRLGSPFNIYDGDNTPWFRAAADSLVQATRNAASRALGIESQELHGGWRLVPSSAFGPGVAPDGEHPLNLELYFHDTLAGGAGFSTQIDELGAPGDWQLPEVIRQVLDCDMNCMTSCTNCLQTPDNQMHHEILNRHWARQLLDYIVSEERPQIDSDQRSDYVARLAAVFSLYEGAPFTYNHSHGDTYEFSHNGNSESFTIQSELAEVVNQDTTITDLEMDSRLHEAIEKIRAALC